MCSAGFIATHASSGLWVWLGLILRGPEHLPLPMIMGKGGAWDRFITSLSGACTESRCQCEEGASIVPPPLEWHRAIVK